MAKAPMPGLAKTRLIPALGAAGAAQLAARFLEATMHNALDAMLGPVILSAAPDRHHTAWAPVLASVAARPTEPQVLMLDQSDGDLGQRMSQAFDQVFEVAETVLLMGTDAPALDAGLLHEAAAALVGPVTGARTPAHDAVFVPTFDGGYVLVGLRRERRDRLADLFDDIPWSTDRVMALTRERLIERGWRVRELPAIADVDEPADLIHVPPGWLPNSRTL
jgi:uncharacterized protein